MKFDLLPTGAAQRCELQNNANEPEEATMKASDLMTTGVVSVRPDTTVHEIASLLVARAISGVPVVGGGTVVGVVTAGDLVRRHEIGTDRASSRHRRWWRRLVEGDTAPRDYVKAHARCASDVMTTPVVSVQRDAPIARIIDLFERHGIRRVPVLDGLRLVGILSRSDILKAFAALAPAAGRQRSDDESIFASLVGELSRQPWWRDESSVTVCRGTVHYWGVFHSDDERVAARVAAQNVPGVRGIRDHRVHISALSPLA
jgi:CBS domain-containing protein